MEIDRLHLMIVSVEKQRKGESERQGVIQGDSGEEERRSGVSCNLAGGKVRTWCPNTPFMI